MKQKNKASAAMMKKREVAVNRLTREGKSAASIKSYLRGWDNTGRIINK